MNSNGQITLSFAILKNDLNIIKLLRNEEKESLAINVLINNQIENENKSKPDNHKLGTDIHQKYNKSVTNNSLSIKNHPNCFSLHEWLSMYII